MTKENLGAKYRYEYKYMIDGMQEAILRMRVKAVMKADGHADKNGSYRIRSLYFDTFNDSCYYENEGGIGEREKFRIRIYNGDKGHIMLEKKSKKRQMTLKEACPLSEDTCHSLMRGQRIKITSSMTTEQKKLLWEIQKKALRPTVIVEYLRFPFTEQSGNVRVTFDESIGSSNDISGFLEKALVVRPILEKGMSVLEVKWDEFLPDYIKSSLQLDALQRCSFSKYYLCRKYNTYGGIRI